MTMKPRQQLGRVTEANGACLELYEHDGAYTILCDGQVLMDSRTHASEYQMGQLGMQGWDFRTPPRILIGGLGLGYTLKGVLENAPPEAAVCVVESSHALVTWNHRWLQSLNGHLLSDPRVSLEVKDVGQHVREAGESAYHVILLDVDNGPVAMVEAGNRFLYARSGLRAIRNTLAEGGRAVFWSASQDDGFETRLRQAGFLVEAVPAKRYPSARRAACVLYVAQGKD